MKKKTEFNIPNYLIDKKLKKGKHYPNELLQLIYLFERGRAAFHLEMNMTKPTAMRIELEIRKIEKTFLNFFLNAATLQKYRITGKDIKKKFKGDLSKAQEAMQIASANEAGPCDIKVVMESIRRVNRKLRSINPRIQGGPDGYKLDAIPFLNSDNAPRIGKNPRLLSLFGWGWLAKTIDGLNPSLVKECAYCKKIVISRQVKKYHPECRSKYFSEKATREGINRKRVAACRKRKEKRAKRRK